jgi:hypothetical protein
MTSDCQITLTPAEARLASWLGRSRQAYNEKQGRTHHFTLDPGKQAAYHCNGVAGELATAKLLNVYPEIATEIEHNHYDLIFYRELIDVKTTTRLTSELLVPLTGRNREPCDIYVAAFCDWMGKKNVTPTVRVIGWAFHSTAWHPQFEDKNQLIPCQRVPGAYLRPMSELSMAALRFDQAHRRGEPMKFRDALEKEAAIA